MHIEIDDQHPSGLHRVWKNQRDAEVIARANQRDERDGWTYQVVSRAVGGYRVRVHDEAGRQLGYL